jgi:tetratricopeptide (TPR) repeat protein
MKSFNSETIFESLAKMILPGSIFLSLAIPAITPAATLRPNDNRVAAVVKTVDYVFADSFEAAYNAAELITDTLPGKPIYNLVVASILIAEMTDREDYSRKNDLFKRLDSSKRFFQKWTKGNPGDPWGHFFLGTVHAYKSMWHGQTRSWLKSFIEGLKCRGKYDRTIKLDPTLYDAYTGIGSYHYWSSAKLGKYIPFIPDNRKKGLEELRLAKDSSYISSRLAATGLAWALIEENKLPEALKIAQELYRESSGGRVSMWILGAIYWKWGRLNEAERYYAELLKSLNAAGNQNNYNLIFCRYRKGVCLYMMKDYRGAKEQFDTLLSYKISKEVRKRHKKTLEKTREYLKKTENHIMNKRK